VIFQCPVCKNQQNLKSVQDKKFTEFKCNECLEKYFSLEGIYFIMTEKDDFFNLKRKLDRYIKNMKKHP
jgi:uncharacterized protein YbaR (Trm112 family)